MLQKVKVAKVKVEVKVEVAKEASVEEDFNPVNAKVKQQKLKRTAQQFTRRNISLF